MYSHFSVCMFPAQERNVQSREKTPEFLYFYLSTLKPHNVFLIGYVGSTCWIDLQKAMSKILWAYVGKIKLMLFSENKLEDLSE